VRASAKGQAAVTSEVFELRPGDVRAGVDLQLLAAGRVAVTMSDVVPFATARARLLDENGEPKAGVAPVMQMMRKGQCTLDGLRAGRWRVEVMLPSATENESRVVDVAAGQTSEVTF
jgi:hypothetical protein